MSKNVTQFDREPFGVETYVVHLIDGTVLEVECNYYSLEDGVYFFIQSKDTKLEIPKDMIKMIYPEKVEGINILIGESDYEEV